MLQNTTKTPIKHQKEHKIQNTKNITVVSDSINSLNVFSSNANGMKKKIDSLKYLIDHMNIGLFTLQETNFPKKGRIKINNFEIFEAIRKKDGGGTMIGIHKSLQPVLIEEYSEDFELIVVEMKVDGKNICIISGYGPQESWSLEKRMPFFYCSRRRGHQS